MARSDTPLTDAYLALRAKGPERHESWADFARKLERMLHAEVKDAERYRWLRAHGNEAVLSGELPQDAYLDEFIDAVKL